MRKGYEPRLVFDKKNRLVALATGSDACAEHECGIEHLMRKLGAMPPGKAEDAAIVQALRAGEPVQYPDLMEKLRVTNMRALHFDVVGADAVLWSDFAGLSAEYNAVENLLKNTSEFSYPHKNFSSGRDLNIAAMWDDNSFAIKVRTPRYVKALQGFFEAAQRGDVMFGGRFFTSGDVRIGGIILVNREMLRTEHVQAQRAAQAAYEKSLRLQAASQLEALNRELKSIFGTHSYWDYFTYIWAAWADSSDESQGVRYKVNTSSQAQRAGLQYAKPYRFEELVEFAHRESRRVAA